jgi:hypothetical protein
MLDKLKEELIEFCHRPELEFDEKELQYIKDHANVSVREWDNGFNFVVHAPYGNSCGGSYRIGGSFTSDKGKYTMNIYAGFSANPIGQIDDSYTCKRPNGTNYIDEFDTILSYMFDARIRSLKADRAYMQYVIDTGDLS